MEGSISVNDDKSNATAVCSNCNKYVEIEAIFSIFEPSNISSIETGEIKIWDVTAYLYRMGKIPWDDFNIHLKKTDYNRESYKNELMEDSFGMCDLCFTLLSTTYKAFKQFESLTHKASLIQQIQNVCTENWKAKTEFEPLLFSAPNSQSLLSPANNQNENLSDSYNFDDNQSIDVSGECFTEEWKYETDNNLFGNESLQDSIPKVDQSSEQPNTKMFLRSSKQLVVKIEKISEEDLKYYNDNNKGHSSKVSSRINRQKRRKSSKNGSHAVFEINTLEYILPDVNSLPFKNETAVGKRKVKPVHKLKHSTAIKKKNCPKQQKKVQPSTPKDKKKFECEICGKRFSNRDNLRRMHMPTHFQDTCCKLCGKSFTYVGSLKKHMKLVHKQASEEFIKEIYKSCEICGKTMLRTSLNLHMEIHGPRKSLKCDKCDKEYLNKFTYEEHLLTHTKNFTPYLCRYCGMALNDKNTLRIHEKRHTEGKKFSCEICSKKFFFKTDVERHMAVHSDEKRFVCDECGVSYKHKSQLNRHKRIHEDVAENGEYSSKCKYCGRLFKHSTSLPLHMQSHEKKFECPFCQCKPSHCEDGRNALSETGGGCESELRVMGVLEMGETGGSDIWGYEECEINPPNLNMD